MQTNVHHIFNLNETKTFSEDDAYELVNLFLAVTVKAKNQINGLSSKLEYYKSQPEEADKIQFELNEAIQKWSEKMRRLGGTPLALYKVKIPAENGFFIWEHPKATLEFFID